MRVISCAVLATMFLLVANSWAAQPLRLKAFESSVLPEVVQTGQTEFAKGLYILQWKDSVTLAEKQKLKSNDLAFVSYIPENAFLVKLNKEKSKDFLAQFNFVERMIPVKNFYKMEPGLVENGVFSLQDQTQVFLTLAADANEIEVSKYLDSVVKVSDSLWVATAKVAQLWELAKREDVLWLEKYYPLETAEFKVDRDQQAKRLPIPNYTGFESGTRVMQMELAYQNGFDGRGMIVAMADTGLDSGDIATLIPDFQGQVKSGFAMGLFGSSWADPHSHGTHVSGSIVGNGKSSDGNIHGAAYGAQLVAEGLWSDLLNNISVPNISNLFQTSYDEGARIQSNSWGMRSDGRYDSLTAQVDTFMYENPEFLVVFAAGNEGADRNKDGVIDESSMMSPASAKNILTVGASKNLLLEGGIQRTMIELRDGEQKWGVEPIASSKLSEDPNGMAAFSSRGPTKDGRFKPDVVAPGTNIVSARSSHPDASLGWGEFSENYLFMGGTSMAAPLASGAATVVRQYLVDQLGDRVSAAMLKATMLHTAKDLFPGQFGLRRNGQEQPSRRPNNHQGWGRVDMQDFWGENARNLQLFDEWDGLAEGEIKEWTVELDTQDFLKVTMTYTDAPAAAMASRALVNDMDLELITPSGDKLYPNRASAPDRKNNVENIDFTSTEAGVYTVRVKANKLPQAKNGRQSYALVISSAR